MKPLVSPEIAYVPYRLARAGSRRRLVRRHSRLREAITETAAPRRPATPRQVASRVIALRSVIERREDEPWA